MRYVSIDLGDRRTGVAVGDAATRLVLPVGVIEVPIDRGGGAELVEAIARVVGEHLGESGPGEIVLGLPINMDGSEGSRAKLVRTWATLIASRCGRVVRFQDERLTSSAADWELAQSGLTHKQKKSRRDALAAAAILRDFLESIARPGDGAPDMDWS